MLVLTRLGLLTMAIMSFVSRLATQVPLTLDVASWYAYGTALAFLACAALAGYGFYTSLAGRPLFGEKLLEE